MFGGVFPVSPGVQSVYQGADGGFEGALCDHLEQRKQYEADLIAKGISKERIRKYGFAFEGKQVLIG